jgi:hypothetical protein
MTFDDEIRCSGFTNKDLNDDASKGGVDTRSVQLISINVMSWEILTVQCRKMHGATCLNEG